MIFTYKIFSIILIALQNVKQQQYQTLVYIYSDYPPILFCIHKFYEQNKLLNKYFEILPFSF